MCNSILSLFESHYLIFTLLWKDTLSQMVSLVPLILVLFLVGIYRVEENGPVECMFVQ